MELIVRIQRENHFVKPRVSCIKILRALSNERRMSILLYLQSRGSASVDILAEYLCVSEASVSRHLRILRSSLLLEKKQTGAYVNHYLSSSLPKLVRLAMRDHKDNLTKLLNY